MIILVGGMGSLSVFMNVSEAAACTAHTCTVKCILGQYELVLCTSSVFQILREPYILFITSSTNKISLFIIKTILVFPLLLINLNFFG